MQCQFCGKDLPEEHTGKRPRQYCNDAHRQAAFRRRHPQKISVLKRRIRQLERELAAVKKSEPSHNTTRNAMPIDLEHFASIHGIAFDDAKRLTTMKPAILKPDEQGRIDAHGQRIFWQAYQGSTHTWHECEDCPHEE